MADLLIVDDDEAVVEPLKELLKMEGHGVRIAKNGEEGLSEVDKKFPDAVLLDVEMPVMDGPAMALQMFLRDVGREKIPIFLLSGAPGLESVAEQVGTLYYLEKPYDLDEFLELLNRVLTERRAPHPPSAPVNKAG